MAEYTDIDGRVVVTDTRGRELETTVRHILEFNKGVYTVADVRPVVRGIWEKQDANFVCNEVGFYAAAYRCNRCGKLNVAETNYCPNCGADMREKVDGKT